MNLRRPLCVSSFQQRLWQKYLVYCQQIILLLLKLFGTVHKSYSCSNPSTLFPRLIEGTYPEYEKVIPAQFDSSAVVDRKEFAGAVDRVSLLAKDMSYNVIRYDWSEEQVTLSSQNAEIGMAKEEIPVEFKGTPFTISFNGRYISDILRHSTGDNIHMYLKQNGPVVIRQDNNPNYTYVVTPVRTNS